MQVIIQSPGSNGIAEWTIIELQGELESKSEEALGGKLIGDLHYNHDGNPILIVGHHILQGKTQELEKPFIVINKDKTDEMSDEKSDVKYDVTAVIKKKLVFKTRPKPIVGEVIKKIW